MFEFCAANEGKVADIPKRVRVELKFIRDVLGLIVADCGAPLRRGVWCADAEEGDDPHPYPPRRKPKKIDPGGFGVVATVTPTGEVLRGARRAETHGCAVTET